MNTELKNCPVCGLQPSKPSKDLDEIVDRAEKLISEGFDIPARKFTATVIRQACLSYSESVNAGFRSDLAGCKEAGISEANLRIKAESNLEELAKIAGEMAEVIESLQNQRDGCWNDASLTLSAFQAFTSK